MIGMLILGLSTSSVSVVRLQHKDSNCDAISSTKLAMGCECGYSMGSIPLPVYLDAGEYYLVAASVVISLDEVQVDGVKLQPKRTVAIIEEDCRWVESKYSMWYTYEMHFGQRGTYFRDISDENVLYVYFISEDWKSIVAKYRYKYRDGRISEQYEVRCDR